jgi:dipeptidyl aminopeptidase/acylaminoacyl peptidase
MVAVPTAQAAFPGGNGRIAVNIDSRGSNVFTTDVSSFTPSGAAFQDLHRETGGSAGLAFSPGGTKAALARAGVRRHRGIYLMRADGRGRRRLLTRPPRGWRDIRPDWSSDERSIVYERSLPPGRAQSPLIKVYRAGRARTIASGRTPAWSSRGTIAFNRGDEIFVMRSDGSAIRRVTSGQTLDWSPRGQWILFQTANRELAMVRPDGTGTRVLLPPSSPGASFAALRYVRGAVFAPDGRSVAVAAAVGNDFGLYVLRLDGSFRKIDAGELETQAWRVLDWQPRRRR